MQSVSLQSKFPFELRQKFPEYVIHFQGKTLFSLLESAGVSNVRISATNGVVFKSKCNNNFNDRKSGLPIQSRRLHVKSQRQGTFCLIPS